ncbi:hypothetical protein BJV82DRAFT_667783 [Fennellomyces sp. T-0311]|nr:hypothetical protein BJV82DRAFT_667783 [Fennellomyces sp. T-0311]
MHPFLHRTFDKPLCDVLDGCQNFYNNLNNLRTPSLLDPTQQRRENNSKKRQPPKKPQRGIMCRDTFDLLPKHEWGYQVLPTSEPATMGPYEIIHWPPIEPRIATDDLSESMMQAHETQPSNDELPPLKKEQDSNRCDKVAAEDEPCDRYIKQLICATRLYGPAIEKEEENDFVLVTMLMTTRTTPGCQDNVNFLPVYSTPSTVYVVSQ